MNNIPEPHKLNSNDPRSPFHADGFKPQLQPRFVRELNPDHLKQRTPLRNPFGRWKNTNPLKEAFNFEKYIWEGVS
jgi:hypothetical protein